MHANKRTRAMKMKMTVLATNYLQRMTDDSKSGCVDFELLASRVASCRSTIFIHFSQISLQRACNCHQQDYCFCEVNSEILCKILDNKWLVSMCASWTICWDHRLPTPISVLPIVDKHETCQWNLVALICVSSVQIKRLVVLTLNKVIY